MPTEPDPRQLREMYWDGCLTLREVAGEIGRSYTATQRLFDRLGIPRRARGSGGPRGAGVVAGVDAEEMVRLFRRGLSLRALGKVADVHHTTVRRVLEFHGEIAPLPRRQTTK